MSARTIPELLRARAAGEPERVALLTDQGDALSFADWDARSDTVAGALARRGIGSGRRVGLRFGPAEWTGYGVAYCGAQKAGAVPAALPGLLAAEAMPELLRRHEIEEVVDGERLADLEDDGAARPDVEPVDPAQVLFTSGTTAAPKAVAASHANLLRELSGEPDPLSHSTHLLHAFPLGTQAGQVAMLGSLAGPAVVAMTHFDVTECCALVERHRVGSLLLVPTMAFALLRSDAYRDFDLSSVVLVASTGAPLPFSVASQLRQVFPAAAVVNVYGTTESGPATTKMLCDERRPASVGRPVDGAEVRIADAEGRALAPYEHGEVWLHARGVLPRSYLDDPEATAVTFRDGWTRTGDVGYADEDGFLYLVDREDDVVNTGGLRVSTIEVEAAIQRHPAVAEAAVLGLPHPTLGELLVAAVVPHGELDPAELKVFLRRLLRTHQVPAEIVVVDALPRVPAGKVRKAELRELLLGRTGAAGSGEPPSETERLVARVWERALGVGSVGRDESFFRLGGDSLSGAEVVAALGDAVSIEVPATLPFVAPTVRAQAAWLDEALAEAPAAPRLVARSAAERARLGPMPELYWEWMHRVTPARPVPNVPLALRLRGRLDAEALRSAIGEIVRRHDVLRSSFEPTPEGPVLRPNPFEPPPVELLDVSDADDAPEDRAREIVAEFLAEPFAPSAEVQLRAPILRLGPLDHVLSLTLSHLVADGWSTGVLLRELRVLYDAFRRGEPSPLLELPVRYADVAEWERSRYEAGRAFWRRRLAEPPPLPRLPGFEPASRFEPTSHGFGLDPSLVRGLGELGQTRDATFFMVVAALWAGLVGTWANEPDVLVSTPLAGRTRAETEQLIGCLFRSVPLRVAVSPSNAFEELLDAVRAAALEAYEHQTYPVVEFAPLVEQPAGLRYESRRAAPELPGLETSWFAEDVRAIQTVDPHDGVYGRPPELIVEDRGPSCACTLVYNAAAMGAAAAEAVSTGLVAAAARAVDDPSRRVADVFSSEPLVARPSRPSPPGPPPDPEPPGCEPTVVDEPQTDFERLLCQIFEGLLRSGPVGADVDLYDLGAHSLVMMQAAARLEEASGYDVPRRWFYEEATIAELAARIESELAGATAAGVATSKSSDRRCSAM